MKRILLSLGMTFLIAGAAGAGREEPSAMTLSETIDRMEAVFARYFKDDPRGRTVGEIHRLVSSYNREVEGPHPAGEREGAEIEAAAQDLRNLGDELAAREHDLRHKPDPRDAAAVRVYNEKVEKFNQLAVRQREATEAYNERVGRFNAAVTERDRNLGVKRRELETRRSELERSLEELDRWFAQKQDQQYGAAVNQLFADLKSKERRAPKDPGIGDLLRRVRTLRRQIAEYAARKEEETDGVLILPAFVCGEECYFILDTGAAKVVLSPYLVAALDLEGGLGEQKEGLVAGGLVAMGRELTIPHLRLGAAEATEVPGLQMRETTLGVDGLLGRSFLKRFVLTVDDRRNPKVTLQPK